MHQQQPGSVQHKGAAKPKVPVQYKTLCVHVQMLQTNMQCLTVHTAQTLSENNSQSQSRTATGPHCCLLGMTARTAVLIVDKKPPCSYAHAYELNNTAAVKDATNLPLSPLLFTSSICGDGRFCI